MLKKILWPFVVLIIAIALYFIFWPVPIAPVAWEAPSNPGYTGSFTANERLKDIETFAIAGNHGPEDIALDARGRIYAATHDGNIVRLEPDGSNPKNWVNTNGRPLGIDFDKQGHLIVADAYRGLLSVSPDGTISELSTSAGGIPLGFTDDVDVAEDGKIYFSDASTKFKPKMIGDSYKASQMDVIEHGGNGRLLVYDPATKTTKILLSGLNFANGVAVSHDQTYVLVSETGSYRVIRYWIAGQKKGTSEIFINSLPGFNDNISTGNDNRYWIAFMAPRNALLDSLSNQPFLRKVIQRMPDFIKPQAAPYGHIIAVDGQGKILLSLQDPSGAYPFTTSATEAKDYLYIGSLVAPVLGRIHKDKIGI
jgi:sugar lactone lactonase YvrE